MVVAADVTLAPEPVRILVGDVRASLATLPDRSVHCGVTSPPYWGLRSYVADDAPEKPLELGLEATPEEYVANMVDVFRGVHRVLRDDGTLWLNLGDSYAGSRCGPQGATGEMNDRSVAKQRCRTRGKTSTGAGLKSKDLVGMPWMVAFALRSAGWYLRSDIVWAKPNPMPESVTDRPTKSHEYIFLLTKSPTYFYDAEAIKERCSLNTHSRGKGVHPKMADVGSGVKQNASFKAATAGHVSHRNKRTVWTVASRPYAGAHFATFPPDLVVPCILAGTSARGCCPACGAPWERQVERDVPPQTARGLRLAAAHVRKNVATGGTRATTLGAGAGGSPPVTTATVGWSPSCACGAGEPVPCTVLDPFGGSGTTAAVALAHGRRAVLCELNPAYADLARARIAQGLRPSKPKREASATQRLLFGSGR